MRIQPRIFNFSQRELSGPEVEILKKGLKFTPSPTRNNLLLQQEVEKFDRSMRLTEFFLHEENIDDSLVRNPSSFTPKCGRNKELDAFLENVKQINPGNTHQRKSNIHETEREAISRLTKDESIIIKEADKGGAVVIMEKQYYKKIMLTHLADKDTYVKQDNYQIAQVASKIKNLSSRYKNALTKKEIDYLTNFDSKDSLIYGLPKIHKSKSTSDAITHQNSEVISIFNPPDLTIRPIIAGPSNPTSHLSHLIHLLLEPLLPLIPSFIKDTFDFLKHLPRKINPSDILITMDIVSLYTNIPHQLGLEAIEFWLKKHPSILPDRIPRDFVLEATHIILNNNYFQFDETIYLQIKGTAMGTKMAPVYANLTIGYLESKLYNSLPQTIPSGEAEYITHNWKRYLDDCFIIWKGDNLTLDLFEVMLQNLHPNIKFTIEKSGYSIPFLDVLIIKNGENITTDIYRKPTDTLNYIDYRSCHPRHIRINIPFTLARRIADIVSDPELMETRFQELKEILIKKNYPRNLIERGIEQARNPRRPKKTPEKNVIPFITTHNPNNPNTFTRAKLLFNNFQSPKMKEVSQRFTLINSKKQPKNLKRTLTSAKFSATKEEWGTSQCNQPRCGTCPHIMSTKEVTFNKMPSNPFHIRGTFNCLAKNVIYVITCPKCGLQYIGQTSNLRNRVTLHKQHNKEPHLGLLPVNKHLRTCTDSSFPPFKICPIMYKEDKNDRLLLETHFINLYQPELNAN